MSTAWIESLPARLASCRKGASREEVFAYLERPRLHRLAAGNPEPGPTDGTRRQRFELVELNAARTHSRHRYDLVITWSTVDGGLRFVAGGLVERDD